MWAPGLLAQHKSLKQRWSVGSGDPQTVGFFPAVDCCCCRYVGLFTLGFLRLGLLFALVSWTTKKDRTTIAPKKANTGMVWPTSWLYRPGIIPKEMGKDVITKGVWSRGGFELQHQIWLLHSRGGKSLGCSYSSRNNPQSLSWGRADGFEKISYNNSHPWSVKRGRSENKCSLELLAVLAVVIKLYIET